MCIDIIKMMKVLNLSFLSLKKRYYCDQFYLVKILSVICKLQIWSSLTHQYSMKQFLSESRTIAFCFITELLSYRIKTFSDSSNLTYYFITEIVTAVLPQQ